MAIDGFCRQTAKMVFALILLANSAAIAAEDTLGRTVENFVLNDVHGKSHQLADYQDSELVVLYFTGTECPLAKLYGPRMQELATKYASHVAFLGVNSNVQDSVAELATYAREHGIQFPMLKDPMQKLADQMGAERTPEVFVLDGERQLRYRGRIDGQFTFGSGVGLAQPAPKRHDLAEAIEELLSGKEVSVPFTEARGCLIGRVKPTTAAANVEVTYSQHIAKLLQDRCVECHREGQIAPFALTDYEEVAGWGDMISEVVREQRMPPWHANPDFGHFANANRLTDQEKQLLYTWVENGCPEGDPEQLPTPRDFNDAWFMSQEPDEEIYMSDEPVDVKAAGVEDYRYYVVDPQWKEDRWVRLAECLPGNRQIVHHIIVYIQSPDAKNSNIGEHELLVGYAPGTRPVELPTGWARRIPAGAKLIFEMHYTPIGTPQKDRSKLGLVFMDEKDVTHQAWTTNAINTSIAIPPKAADHRETATKTFQQDVQLLSLFPHMHMRGKAFRYEVTYPDGQHEVLLDIPQYDFNWQTSFVLNKVKQIPRGTRLLCTAVYDNSDQNLANPDPSQWVRWGEQTWQEMMIGWHDVAVPRKVARPSETKEISSEIAR